MILLIRDNSRKKILIDLSWDCIHLTKILLMRHIMNFPTFSLILMKLISLLLSTNLIRIFINLTIFMTNGLLISRQSKLKLQKLTATSRHPTDILKLNQYRNIYNSVIWASQKLYFELNLIIHKGITKRLGNSWKKLLTCPKAAIKAMELK